MGDGSGIGLIVAVGADATAARQGFAGFSSAATEATARAGAGLRGVTVAAGESGNAIAAIAGKANPSLLSARESARLLSEEIGVHVPRGVTSALSKMGEIGPLLATLGPAMLGFFAVEEAVRFGKEIVKLVDDFNEVGRSESRISQIAKEVESDMERIAKTSSRAAQKELAELNAMIVHQEITVEAIKSAEEGFGALNPIIGQITQAYYVITGHAKELTKSEDELKRQYLLRDKLINILGEDEAKEHKKAAAAVGAHIDRLAELLAKERDQAEALEIANNKERQLLKAYQDEVRAIDAAVAAAGKKGLSDKQASEAEEARTLAVRNYHMALAQLAPVFPPIVEEMRKIEKSLFAERVHQQALAMLGLDDAAKKVKLSIPDYATQVKLLGPAVTMTATATHQLTAAQIAGLPTQRELLIIHQNLVKLFPQYTKEQIDAKAAELVRNQALIQLLTKTEQLGQGTRAYREELKQLIGTIQQLSGAERENLSISAQWVNALKDEKQAIEQNTVASVQGVAQGVAALIGGRRAQAAVEGAFDTAKAIEFWAQFIGSWGTDVDAALAATQYTVAAVEMFKIAGSGSTSSAAGGGGGSVGATARASSGSGPAGAANQPMGPTAAGALPAQTGQGPGITSFGGGGGPALASVSIHNDFSNAVIYGGPSGLRELSEKIAAPMAAALSNYTQRQGGNLVAKSAINPPKAGR